MIRVLSQLGDYLLRVLGSREPCEMFWTELANG